MNIQEELRINGYQPVYGLKGTEGGDFFEGITAQLKRSGFNPSDNVRYLMSRAYSQGVIHGKRAERARRKKI